MVAYSSLVLRNSETSPRSARATRAAAFARTASHAVVRCRRAPELHRALLVALAACASCGGDDGSSNTDAGHGGIDAGAETSVGEAGAREPDGGARGDGTFGSDAAGTSDAPAAGDGARDSATTDRAADTMNPPRGDAQSDAARDSNVGADGTDASSDLGALDGVVDTNTGDVAIDTSLPPPDAPASCALCASYGTATQAGKITTSSLDALSGIGASLRNSGVVYVHNDRNVAQFSAVSEAGTLLGTFNVTGVTVDDIEDMAVAHCPAGTCVYIADVGGNISPRTQFAVIRAPEPQVDVNAPGGTTSIAGEKLVYSYPDGANHNAESILVDPKSDTIFVITKVAAGMPSAVYKFPATFGGTALTATKVIDLNVPKSNDREATSASAHPCEPAFLLRTYNTLYEFRAAPGASLEAAFAATPTVVPVATETQSEGVTYRADGRGYFTTTEGSQPALNRVGCQ
jgi:hypothetical protein